jgi:hypothetical protein
MRAKIYHPNADDVVLTGPQSVGAQFKPGPVQEWPGHH